MDFSLPHFTDVEAEAQRSHFLVSDGRWSMSLPCGWFEGVPHPPTPFSKNHNEKSLENVFLFFFFEITHTGREGGMVQVGRGGSLGEVLYFPQTS